VHIGLKVLAESFACEVALLERLGRFMRIESPSRLASHTPIQWEVEGQEFLGQVIGCVPRDGHFEVWLGPQQVMERESLPSPAWQENPPASVMDGLLKLNEQLLWFQQLRGRGGKDCPPDIGNSGNILS
jgi:hypothetical protein